MDEDITVTYDEQQEINEIYEYYDLEQVLNYWKSDAYPIQFRKFEDTISGMSIAQISSAWIGTANIEKTPKQKAEEYIRDLESWLDAAKKDYHVYNDRTFLRAVEIHKERVESARKVLRIFEEDE